MTALDKLIEAVEAGEVSDWAFGSGYPRTVLGDKWETGMNAYCGSLDAALALHEALLPGWRARLDIGRRRRCWMISPDNQKLDAYGLTPARAWLLAVLKAYRSIKDDNR